MYDIVGYNSNNENRVSSRYKTGIPTLIEAEKLRWACGDIVVHSGTDHVVTDTAWLWPWEKEDPKSYAHRKILKQKQLDYEEEDDMRRMVEYFERMEPLYGDANGVI